MGIDHSLIYKDKKIKNLHHRKRLNTILSILEKEEFEGKTFADIGCSNGYITSIINDKFKPARSSGYDHSVSNLEKAKSNYPTINFNIMDLNKINSMGEKYDIVTCIETLEHVGNLQNALTNLLNLTNSNNGFLLITVPIEIGFYGTLKFLAKTILYKYNLSELPQERHLYLRYFITLLVGRKMSNFRSQRNGWGTHFGFDYRDIDNYLNSKKITFKAFNNFATRFYLVRL